MERYGFRGKRQAVHEALDRLDVKPYSPESRGLPPPTGRVRRRSTPMFVDTERGCANRSTA